MLTVRPIYNFNIVLIASILLFSTSCGNTESKIDRVLIVQLLENKEYDKALVEINKALKIDPECHVCYFSRAYIFEQQGRRIEALENYNLSIKLYPKDPQYYFYRGRSYTTLFPYDKFSAKDFKVNINLGIQDLSRGIDLNPDDKYKYYRERGRLHSLNSDYESSLLDYKAALNLKKNDASLLCDVGKCYVDLNELDKALEYLLVAERVAPNDGCCYWPIARIYSLKGDKKKAERYLELAVKLNDFVSKYGIDKRDKCWDSIRDTEIFKKAIDIR